MVDKDPNWRHTAIFTRDEEEQVLSDERIPEDRRAFYALLFLGALRFGEAAARRWRDYDPEASPLGRLRVSTAMHAADKREKGVKTDRPREVPVHPTLAKVLATWKLSGWPLYFDRAPGPDDLIVPSRKGSPRSVAHMLKKFHEDLARLGLRPRRQHDARRTFISLARADGARPDVLRWVTHGPTGSVMDDYTTLPWESLCAAVACLKVGLKTGEVVPMRLAASAEVPVPADFYSESTTVAATDAARQRKRPRSSEASGPEEWRGVRDSNAMEAIRLRWVHPGRVVQLQRKRELASPVKPTPTSVEAASGGPRL